MIAVNMTYTDVYCAWLDTNSVWQISSPLQPSLGFLPGYPSVVPGNFGLSSIIKVQVVFGTDTSMPYNSTFVCWAFPRLSVREHSVL